MRHEPLLQALADRQCTVIAPCFERLLSPRPTDEQLLLRARRLRIALHAITTHLNPQVPIVGIGHSIGATVLLGMAHAALWTSPKGPLPLATNERLTRLVLLAPPTGFFQAPAALDLVHAAILVWAGGNDTVTPPAQAQFLKERLGDAVDLRIEKDAGHFSFMHTLPPNMSDVHPDRSEFLGRLTADLCAFVVA
jgi:pimeloyl-ACP methyl ester carboxylesterase